MTRASYRSVLSDDATASFRTLLAQATPRTFEQLPPTGTETLEGDVAALVDRIEAATGAPVLSVDLSRDGWPVAVSRVVAPGLEGPTESPLYRPGTRAKAAAARDALDGSAR
jgi:ribosomal protein S12 methylthiotransferase accessory factor